MLLIFTGTGQTPSSGTGTGGTGTAPPTAAGMVCDNNYVATDPNYQWDVWANGCPAQTYNAYSDHNVIPSWAATIPGWVKIGTVGTVPCTMTTGPGAVQTYNPDPSATATLYQAYNAQCGVAKPPAGQPPVIPPTQPPAGQPPQPGAVCAPGMPNPCDNPPVQFEQTTVTLPDFLKIGSVDFCIQKQVLRDGFIKMGQGIMALISGKNPADNIAGPRQQESSEASKLMDALTDRIIGLVTDQAKDSTSKFWSTLSSAIGLWWNVISTSQSCGMTEVIFLCVAKGFLQLLKRFMIGWDIAIWGTLDIEIIVDPLTRVLEYLINDACPAEIPSIGETIEGWIKGTVDDYQAVCWLSLRGADWTVWYPIIRSRRERLTPEEFIQWQRRQKIDDAITESGLRSYGFIEPGERLAKMKLYDELPTVSDFLHFLQRNVFDTQYVQDYGLMEGFEDRFWAEFGDQLRAIGMTKEVAGLHYAAHWLNVPVGQLGEMMQRLRPGRVPENIQFTEDDFSRLLAEQDVAPYFRERLKAIAFRLPQLRQLTSAVKHGLFDRAELIERWKDMGFTPLDAERQADAMLIDANRQEASAAHGYTPGVVSKLAAYDMIPIELAKQYLNPQGFSDQEIDTLFNVAKQERELQEEVTRGKSAVNEYAKLTTKAYGDGVIDKDTAYQALRSAGYSDDAANLELSTISLRVRMEKVDATVKTIRKAFLRGELNQADAVSACRVAGLLDYAAADTVSRWSLEMTVPRQAATTGMIQKWAREGLISIANAEQRLLNIGWSQANVDLLLLELQQTISQAKAKAASRQAKLLAESISAADRAKAAAQAKLCRIYSPSKMTRWYAEGRISDDAFMARFQQCGYPPDVIDNYLSEAKAAKDKVEAAAAKANQQGTSKPSKALSAGRLKSLFAERIVDDNTFVAGLKVLGYDNATIQELLDDAIVAREKKDQQAAKKGPAGIEYTGPGADSG